MQQAPAQTQYQQQPYQQPAYPAAPAPQYQQQPQYQQAPPPPQYQQQPYQQAQYQQAGAQPMMQQPGKPKKNMMLIAIIAIVAVVIVIVAIVLLMGLGGGSSSTLSIVGSPDDSNVNAFYWAANSETVSVDVTVKNNGAVTASGTIHVKVESTMPVLGTKYTAEGSLAITLLAGEQQTFSVSVPMGATQAGLLILSSTVTAHM